MLRVNLEYGVRASLAQALVMLRVPSGSHQSPIERRKCIAIPHQEPVNPDQTIEQKFVSPLRKHLLQFHLGRVPKRGTIAEDLPFTVSSRTSKPPAKLRRHDLKTITVQLVGQEVCHFHRQVWYNQIHTCPPCRQRRIACDLHDANELRWWWRCLCHDEGHV